MRAIYGEDPAVFCAVTRRRTRGRRAAVLVGLMLCVLPVMYAQEQTSRAIDRDLMEVSVEGLHHLYAQHRYTVTQVTQWYLDRIARYDGTYRALLYVDTKGALARAAEEDGSPASAEHGALWGVPIVIKANTSVKGWVTSAGWKGYTIPGKELISPRDALVVERVAVS